MYRKKNLKIEVVKFDVNCFSSNNGKLMDMKNILKIAFLASAIGFFASCETVELELLENPNNITVESADANFVLNDIQLAFNGVVNGYSGSNTGLTRMRYQFGTYANSITDQTANGEWNGSYQMFGNIDLLQGMKREMRFLITLEWHRY